VLLSRGGAPAQSLHSLTEQRARLGPDMEILSPDLTDNPELLTDSSTRAKKKNSWKFGRSTHGYTVRSPTVPHTSGSEAPKL